MKYLIYLLSVYCLIGCGNKKERIVEEIKKAKNERAQAKLNHGAYSFAAKKLLAYTIAAEAYKRNKDNKQMEMDTEIYRQSYETAILQLKGVPNEILIDQKKLDSASLFWELKTTDAQRKIDSLELELKKY